MTVEATQRRRGDISPARHDGPSPWKRARLTTPPGPGPAAESVVVWLGFRVQGAGCRVQGSGFRVQGAWFRVQGSGFRIRHAGFRVQGSGLRG